MDESPLSWLPVELREQILGYVIPIGRTRIDDCMKGKTNYSHGGAGSFLATLFKRNPIMNTCHELQDLSLRVCLRRMELIWNRSLFPPTAEGRSTSGPKTTDTSLFQSLPLLAQHEHIRNLGGVGAMTTDDYLHREGWNSNEGPRAKRHPNWTDNPLEILTLYEEASYIAFQLRKQQMTRNLEHRQVFFTHSYRLQTFTDGNALRPIKRALRGTWKRDTIDIPINILNESTSLRNLDKAITLLNAEQHDKIEAIQREIRREDEAPWDGKTLFPGSDNPMFVDFLCDMDMKYTLWIERVRKFHTALIKVVMLGYRMDDRDVVDLLDEIAAGLPKDRGSRFGAGDEVVEKVVAKLQSIRPFEIEPKYRIVAGSWLDGSEAEGFGMAE